MKSKKKQKLKLSFKMDYKELIFHAETQRSQSEKL